MLKRWTISGWPQLCLGVLCLALFAGQMAAAEKPVVQYDRASDKLSITAENVSLKALLARIGLLSGVGFFMDPKAEQPVSAALKDELKETNPELYELRRQRREELRQQMSGQTSEDAE